MSRARILMLVSSRVTPALRKAVAEGLEPMPEFLDLERRFDFELLDWTRLASSPAARSKWTSLHHVRAAMSRIHQYDAVVSDGEHVGIPLALAIAARRLHIPHVVIGHHVSTRAKAPFFSWIHADRGMTRILLHSREQAAWCREHAGLPDSKVQFLPYYADAGFWRPTDAPQSPMVVAAGREHRDYATLARAMSGLAEPAVIAAGSPHNPAASCAMPVASPPNISFTTADHAELRRLYAAAQVVAVPLLETDFQAGVTSLLEAMAMGKALVVSATMGQRDIGRHQDNCLLVPPGDAGAMRVAIRHLLDNPRERDRLGANARRDVEQRYDLRHFADAVAGLVSTLCDGTENAA